MRLRLRIEQDEYPESPRDCPDSSRGDRRANIATLHYVQRGTTYRELGA